MLPEKLKLFEYYLQRMSMSMTTSYGIKEHVDIIWRQLKDSDDTFDEFFTQFNALSEEALESMNKLDPEENDILDRLAYVFGLTRDFDIVYTDEDTGEKKHVALHLDNAALQTLLKVKVIQNNFKGSYESIMKAYEKYNIPIIYLMSDNNATVEVYMTDDSFTEDEHYMYLNGLFNLESMGITYVIHDYILSQVGVWDSNKNTRRWDKAVWYDEKI